jgi:hypothetical protein
MRKFSIGEVRVFYGVVTNPYQRGSLIGQQRVDALTSFKHGGIMDDFSFWGTPANGGAIELKNPEQIDWSTSNIR